MSRSRPRSSASRCRARRSPSRPCGQLGTVYRSSRLLEIGGDLARLIHATRGWWVRSHRERLPDRTTGRLASSPPAADVPRTRSPVWLWNLRCGRFVTTARRRSCVGRPPYPVTEVTRRSRCWRCDTNDSRAINALVGLNRLLDTATIAGWTASSGRGS